MLYTKIPHGKLLYVLNEITEFDCKVGTKDYVTDYNSGALWSRSKNKLEDLTLSMELNFVWSF